jgi:hypothetical protein
MNCPLLDTYRVTCDSSHLEIKKRTQMRNYIIIVVVVVGYFNMIYEK